MSVFLLHTTALDAPSVDAITAVAAGELEQRSSHYRFHLNNPPEKSVLLQLRQQFPFDINPIPASFDSEAVRLVVSDMDSTFITNECLDELAGVAAIKSEMEKITEAAMRGELDFVRSMEQRVAMLKGLPTEAMHEVYQQRVRLSAGAEEMVQGLRLRNIPVALISGGFVQFTSRLQQDYGLAFSHGIEPEEAEGSLTGSIKGEWIDAEGKAAYLEKLCDELSINTEQCIAIGDGANDVAMLQRAGLGIAFRGKPRVQEQADAVLNYSGLDAVLDFID